MSVLLGDIDSPDVHNTLLNNPAWSEAFEWLKKHGRDAESRAEPYLIRGHDIRALVQDNELVNAEERAAKVGFEAHQREVDLQVCLQGSEIIQWTPLVLLHGGERGPYDPQGDYTLYDPPADPISIPMRPGTFAIFFPEDGHMPGIRLGHDRVRKVVIKLSKDLLTSTVLGPYSLTIDRSKPADELFTIWNKEGEFDTRNDTDINVDNFPLPPGTGEEKREAILFNFGRTIADENVPSELTRAGYRALSHEWSLELNRKHPELMDDYIIIHHHSASPRPWIGREGAPEVICLHKDKGKRRLRTHYADTNWGPHIWFVVEKV